MTNQGGGDGCCWCVAVVGGVGAGESGSLLCGVARRVVYRCVVSLPLTNLRLAKPLVVNKDDVLEFPDKFRIKSTELAGDVMFVENQGFFTPLTEKCRANI